MPPIHFDRDGDRWKMKMRGKKTVVVFSLVKESAEKANKEIEKEIFEELSKHPPMIPWLKKVEKVTVTEAQKRPK